jgi:hypothetical protein
MQCRLPAFQDRQFCDTTPINSPGLGALVADLPDRDSHRDFDRDSHRDFDRNSHRDFGRGSHREFSWNHPYSRFHRFGYWHNHRGYWSMRDRQHVFIGVSPQRGRSRPRGGTPAFLSPGCNRGKDKLPACPLSWSRADPRRTLRVPARRLQVIDASKMLWIVASSTALYSASDCWTDNPSTSAREKLATTP